MKSNEVSRFVRSFLIGGGLALVLVAPFLSYYGLSWLYVAGFIGFLGLLSYAGVEHVRPPRGMEGPDDEIWFLTTSTLPIVVVLTIQAGVWILLRTRSSGPEQELTAMFWSVVVVAVVCDAAWLAAPLILRGRRKTAEPGATDNPDDAQRLREDH